MISTYLGGTWIGNSFGVNPVVRLRVFRIIDLLRWVDRWIEVSEKATG